MYINIINKQYKWFRWYRQLSHNLKLNKVQNLRNVVACTMYNVQYTLMCQWNLFNEQHTYSKHFQSFIFMFESKICLGTVCDLNRVICSVIIRFMCIYTNFAKINHLINGVIKHRRQLWASFYFYYCCCCCCYARLNIPLSLPMPPPRFISIHQYGQCNAIRCEWIWKSMFMNHVDSWSVIYTYNNNNMYHIWRRQKRQI